MLGGLLLFLLLWIGYGLYKRNQFKSDYHIVTGMVIRITPVYKQGGNRGVLYEYSIDGQQYEGSNTYILCDELNSDKLRLMLVNKQFPVAYATQDAKVSVMIITKKDAAMFNYKIADSLLVYDSVLNCLRHFH